MTTGIRASTPADGPGILQLFRAAGLVVHLREHDLQWKYWARREDWPYPRSFVIARGEQIVAHAAVVPGHYLCDGRVLRVLHPVDWAARPGAAGAGLSVARQVSALGDALLAIGGSEQTVQILPHSRFVAMGTTVAFARPLRPLRHLRASEGPAWKIPPRILRRVMWRLAAPRVSSGQWSAQRLGPEQVHRLGPVLPDPERMAALLLRAAQSQSLGVDGGLGPHFGLGSHLGLSLRSEAQLRHVLECPIAPVELLALEQHGALRGYALLVMVPGQARIVDFWIESAERGEWREAIGCLVEHARGEREVAEIVAWASDSILQSAFTTSGFHACARVPMWLRTRSGLPTPAYPLRVQMLDSDAAYQHQGQARWWA